MVIMGAMNDQMAPSSVEIQQLLVKNSIPYSVYNLLTGGNIDKLILFMGNY